jgi:hypothetical protein
MCVIILSEKRLPTRKELLAAQATNGDGAGYCMRVNGSVVWRKGLDAEQIADDIEAGTVTLPAAFHFRMATAGGVNEELTHPFPITRKVSVLPEGRAAEVLMHNGHWHGWSQHLDLKVVPDDGPWSDSRLIAWLLAHGARPARLAEMAGRLLIFGAKKIQTFGSWSAHKGLLYSNLNWLWYSERSERDICAGPGQLGLFYKGPSR